MARSDIRDATKELIYGTGLGEKPAIRRVAATSNLAGTNPWTLDLLAGEGASVQAGDVLSTLGSSDTSDALRLYVLSVSSDTVTVTKFQGGPDPSASTLDGALLEQNPLVTELTIQRSIDTIIASYLYPQVFQVLTTRTATPNLSTGQTELPSTVREIVSAKQKISGAAVDIGFKLVRNVPSTLSSTGVLVELWPADSSTVYFTTVEEVDASTSDVAIQHCIALGAAALALGGGQTPAAVETSKKDTGERVDPLQRAVDNLWRNFITTRNAIAEALSRDTLRLVVDRG